MISGLLSLIALVPGGGTAVAIGSNLVGALLRCKPCLIALAALACFVAGDVRGHRVEHAKCEARIVARDKAAIAARDQRDADIKAAIEEKYQPAVTQLAREAEALKQQVTDYESKSHDGAGSCQLGADALRLRH